MKKLFVILFALILSIALVACGEQNNAGNSDPDVTELALWVYPIGQWRDKETVSALMDQFSSEFPEIHVTVTYLDYDTGDDRIDRAVELGQAPDVVLESPRRLVSDWGDKGWMADLSDLWNSADQRQIHPVCQSACYASNGACYAFPLSMNVCCMAINYDAFKDAGADQYVDTATHTWTTDGFVSAVKALYSHYGETVGTVYCGGQGGDEGTRALVNNLYGGTFTNAKHTAYTIDSEENIQALQRLYDLSGLAFDRDIVGRDEAVLFRQGVLKMAFCWDAAQQQNSDSSEAGRTVDGDEIVFLSFPSQTGESRLPGDIWAFGAFAQEDENHLSAAKTLIRYFTGGNGTAAAVKASEAFPVRSLASLDAIWADDPVMSEYSCMPSRIDDYYQTSLGWPAVRTEWWQLLQRIGNSGNIADEVSIFTDNTRDAVRNSLH